MTDRPRTLRELRESGYRSVSVKTELRRNLLEKLRRRESIFPGIHGYDDTVLPEVENAILSQHDILFLGLRGQAKTRMLRMLTNLLDDVLPIVAGSEIHDDPYRPLSKFARDLVEKKGEDTPIAWIGRDDRYHEKLATPDVTIADLIGEIDLVKHAEGRELANEDVLHFGLIPRSHRGIFCLNELPDLSPKIQVGLFNVLEERDVQIRGFPIRLNLDVCMVFSANPEDYTNRGRIVTPLKDRIGSVIRTHYPPTRELGMVITAENAWTDRVEGPPVIVPKFIEEIVEEVARLARTSPHVNQASGVSTRMSIANYENVLSNAERRSVLHDESPIVCRVSDLMHLVASSRGKMELNLTEEPGQEDKLVVRLVEEAVKTVFDQTFDPKQFRPVVEYVEAGKSMEFGDHLSTSQAWTRIEEIRGLPKLVEQTAARLQPELAKGSTERAFLVGVAEFIFEGLHCHNRLNKKITAGRSKYGG
jgi:magnesium chelatase subunit I